MIAVVNSLKANELFVDVAQNFRIRFVSFLLILFRIIHRQLQIMNCSLVLILFRIIRRQLQIIPSFLDIVSTLAFAAHN